MGDGRKALRTIALGGFPADLTEQAVQAAMSAGQVHISAIKRSLQASLAKSATSQHAQRLDS